MLINSRRAQSIVDFAVAFIAVAGLIVGIVRVWIWFNANYAKRQASFQTSRLIAAGPERPYATKKAPVSIGSTSACPDCAYKPLDLTEDWVFKGTPSGTVSGAEVGEEGTLGPGSACDNQCKTQCLGQASCIGLDGDFDTSCACYKTCALTCTCQTQVQTMVDIYQSQATSLQSQASSLRNSAGSMRDTAEECDDPWEICWWGDWGKTPGELRDAANELDYNATSLEHTAAKASQHATDTAACCEKEDAGLQSQCLKDVETDANCDQTCMTQAQAFYDQCKQSGNVFTSLLCPFKAQINYQACFNSCMGAESATCGERVNSVISSLQAQIENLNSTKNSYSGMADEINNTLSSCAGNATATCNSSCAEASDPTACYNQCYEAERNNCCQQNCCNGSSWGRSCDSPATNCDDSCTTTPCPKCGLSQTTVTINNKIQEINNQISALQQKIQQLPLCCNYEKTADQNSCIENKLTE